MYLYNSFFNVDIQQTFPSYTDKFLEIHSYFESPYKTMKLIFKSTSSNTVDSSLTITLNELIKMSYCLPTCENTKVKIFKDS